MKLLKSHPTFNSNIIYRVNKERDRGQAQPSGSSPSLSDSLVVQPFSHTLPCPIPAATTYVLVTLSHQTWTAPLRSRGEPCKKASRAHLGQRAEREDEFNDWNFSPWLHGSFNLDEALGGLSPPERGNLRGKVYTKNSKMLKLMNRTRSFAA